MNKINLEIVKDKKIDKRLQDIKTILNNSVVMAYKNKEKAFYQVIAKELLEIIDNKLLGDMKLKKFNDNFYRIGINNESYLFLKSNIFGDNLISIDEFLDQKLVKKENQELPEYISSTEKNDIMNSVKDSRELMNNSYGRQQLNSDNFILNLVAEDEIGLKYIFDKMGYFGISVLEYIKIVAGNYDYENEYEDNGLKLLKNTFNSYIVELGAYFIKVINSIEN